MKITRKIKSFTITEMLVVMILSAIVITIAVLVLNLVQKHFLAIRQNLANNTELKTLEQVLWFDFNTHITTFDKPKNSLLCISPLDTVKYTFFSKFVLRNKDTIKVSVVAKDLLLDGGKALKAVDAMQLKLSREHQEKELFIYKAKDASHYMNQDGF